jgi:nucleoside-diphosphate-sugar epimerase
VEFFCGDIRDTKAVEQAIFAADGVIHLAGILGTVETLQHIPETVDVNIVGTINVFEAIKKYKRPCVYITLPDVWKNPYTFTKRTAKDFAFLYNREFNTKINVVCGFNVYGEGQKYKPVRKFAPQWIIGALLGKPLEVYGDGSQLMDLVYVGDVAEILIRALETSKTATEVIDAAPGDAVTVKQVADLMAKMLGAQIVSKPMRAGETSEAVIKGNTETTKRWIGDFRFTPIEEGMERTINWYKEHYRELL